MEIEGRREIPIGTLKLKQSENGILAVLKHLATT